MPGGEALAGGVLPASVFPAGPGCRRRHGIERGSRPPWSLGVLEVLLSVAPGRASVEPQAGASGVLRTAAESAPAHEAAGPGAPPPAFGRAGAPQRDLGPRFHGRCPLRRPRVPDLQCPG